MVFQLFKTKTTYSLKVSHLTASLYARIKYLDLANIIQNCISHENTETHKVDLKSS